MAGIFWLRTCEVTFESTGRSVLYMGVPGSNEEGCRIRFKMWKDWQQEPNFADVTITNPEPAFAREIATGKSEFKKVKVSVGYQGQLQLIFHGEITYARYGRENPTDTYLNVLLRDGDKAYTYAKTNTTLPKDSTGKDEFDALAKAFQEYGVSKGFGSSSLLDLKHTRPYVMSGSAKDYMRSLAKEIGAQWSIQNGDLTILTISELGQGDAVDLNSETGMVGMPEQTTEAIVVRCLINPRIEVLKKIHLDNASIQLASWDLSIGGGGIQDPFVKGPNQTWRPEMAADGVYNVFRIEYDGDTRGNEWYQTLYCISPNQKMTGAGVQPWVTKVFGGT